MKVQPAKHSFITPEAID